MSGYLISIIVFGGVWAILAVSLNLLTGEAGLVSLGQAAFFALGAYTSALLALRAELPFLACLAISALVGGVLTGALGLLALRVRDDFLVFTTIGVNFLVVAVFQYFEAFGGALGLVALPFAEVAGVRLTPQRYAWLVLAVLGLVVAASFALRRTWLGTGLAALREDEQAARALGIPTRAYKVVAFALAGVVAGLAGGLYAFYLGSVFPQNFGFLVSIQVMAMLVLGGLGTLAGAVIGAFLLTALPEVLRPLADYRYTILGLILILVVMVAPDGLVGVARRWLTSLRRRGGQAETTPPAGSEARP
ncbi:MAG: branched-chain amino acid ABC transporter permease [Micromonosporaceae bacterium]|nr:branched-chain amino acid ABC transporter permease [Micromonosporaceae bacterium]